MTCSFPSKHNHKAFFSRPSKPTKPHKDIISLRKNPTICNKFSQKLDDFFNEDPNINDVNIFYNFFTETIIKASESEIPKLSKASNKCPWTNEEFLSLLEKRRICKDPGTIRELGLSIKKLRDKLKNYYFSKLANDINIAIMKLERLKRSFDYLKLIP